MQTVKVTVELNVNFDDGELVTADYDRAVEWVRELVTEAIANDLDGFTLVAVKGPTL